MTEQLTIKGKEVWIFLAPHIREEGNTTTIPTEYFTASYNIYENDETKAVPLNEDNQPRLFLSPVAALEYAREQLEETL